MKKFKKYPNSNRGRTAYEIVSRVIEFEITSFHKCNYEEKELISIW